MTSSKLFCIWISLTFSLGLCYQLVDLESTCSNIPKKLFMTDKGETAGIILEAKPIQWTLEIRDCRTTVKVDPLRGILACVTHLKFKYGCDSGENLTLYNYRVNHSLCDSVLTKEDHRCFTFFTRVSVRYETVDLNPPEFVIVLNSFLTAPCDLYSYGCEKEPICVWNGFVCDGHNNCVDNTDEVSASRGSCTHHLQTILYACVGIVPFLLGLFVFSAFYCIKRRRPEAFAPYATHLPMPIPRDSELS